MQISPAAQLTKIHRVTLHNMFGCIVAGRLVRTAKEMLQLLFARQRN